MDRQYSPQKPVDFFSSAIWTERVSGNGDCQLAVPATSDIIKLLSTGVFLGLKGSDVVMEIDDQTIQNNVMSITGTSLTQHLNDRFIRFTATQNDKSYNITGSPGYILQYLVQNMAIDGDWLNGIQNMGIANPARLKIPYFTMGDWYDDPSLSVTIAVPYGPLYDALKTIADTYLLGIKVAWFGVNDIRFRVYSSVDHTISSGLAELVRFSPDLNNLDNTKEVISAKNFKTHAFVFASGVTGGQAGGVAWPPGEQDVVGSYSGWDLKADMVLADDVTTPVNLATLASVLNQRAMQDLIGHQIIGGVDGQLSPNPQYVYGTHYNLGDIVEVQGTSGIIQRARVTEYIRAQDASGEKAYPTLVAVS
jgi:Siphovirus ReqiPepy6 Gp37-like protein